MDHPKELLKFLKAKLPTLTLTQFLNLFFTVKALEIFRLIIYFNICSQTKVILLYESY